MLKLYSAYSGIFCTTIGILSVVFHDEIPAEKYILSVPGSYALAVFGILLIFIGREYLPVWLTYLFRSDDGSED